MSSMKTMSICLVIQHHPMNIHHQHHFYDGGVPGRGAHRGGKGGTH
jgi:hypothetical protein